MSTASAIPTLPIAGFITRLGYVFCPACNLDPIATTTTIDNSANLDMFCDACAAPIAYRRDWYRALRTAS